MKWIKTDLQKYIHAKEYVDTLLIPLIPFHLSEDINLEKNAFQREVLTLFTNEIEKEFAGRIMLAPDYNYLMSANKEEEMNRINLFIDDAQKQPFEHIFLVTFDSTWKKNEQALEATLLWLPGMHSGDIHSEEMHAIIRDQVEQIGELIRSYW